MQNVIHTLHLFPILDQKLIELLRSLSREEWNRPTRARLWTVKDIATHLLDGNLRTLSFARDGYTSTQPTHIHSYQDLVDYLNQLNADWVKATARLSPEILTDLLETTGREYCKHLQTLDLFDKAIFAVSWAGEEQSFNWFHIAREYTEKWHHQQQIREAVNKPGIMTRELYLPLINTFLMALPYTYRNVSASENTIVKITITSELGGSWFITHSQGMWNLSQTNLHPGQTEVCIDPETAWRLFTKGLSAEEAEQLVLIKGNRALGLPVLHMLSVMA